MRLPGERRRGNAESDRRARSDSTQTREIVPSARLSFGHTGTKRKPATRAAHLKACRIRPPAPNSPHQPRPGWTPLARSATLKDTPRPVAAMRAAHSHNHTAAALPPALRTRHPAQPCAEPAPRLRRPAPAGRPRQFRGYLAPPRPTGCLATSPSRSTSPAPRPPRWLRARRPRCPCPASPCSSSPADPLPAKGRPRSDRLPAPAVVVLALDRLAVSGDPGDPVVAVTAELAGLVARSLVAQRITAGWGSLSRCRCPRGRRCLRDMRSLSGTGRMSGVGCPGGRGRRRG
jgi:hypothetical protein